jgi:hypothetical protein
MTPERPRDPMVPIKHARRTLWPHPYYQNFNNFGDADGFRKQLNQNPEGA